MKSISVIFVFIFHALLFFALLDVEGELLMRDLSTEGMSEQIKKHETLLPKYAHQQEEYIITTTDSLWIFPRIIEPEIKKDIQPVIEPPKIISKPIPIPEPIQPIKPTPKVNIEPTKTPEKPIQKKSTATQSQKGTGSGNKNATGKGSGKNSTDGPAGFIDGNSNQTLLRNIQRCYPLISRRRGEQGLAVVRIHVNADGNSTRTELIQSTNFSRLDKCALESVKSLKVKSKIHNGKAINSYFDQPIRFRLN